MLLQAPRRWVTSPLGFNVLLSLCGGSSNTVQKYVQINKLLKTQKELTIKNVLYHSPCLKLEQIIKNSNPDFNLAQIGKLDTFHQLTHDLHLVKKITDEVPSNTKLILSSICIFKGFWNVSKEGPCMEIYNSFNYTQDIKYEARILELPIQNTDFKLVIIIPNEADVLQTLFEKLNEKGLTAAINSIQPLFTATSELKAPCINVVSKVELGYKYNNPVMSKTAFQYGIANIDRSGVYIEVMTSLYSASVETNSISDKTKVESPFYFAITYQDTPIFTGQYA